MKICFFIYHYQCTIDKGSVENYIYIYGVQLVIEIYWKFNRQIFCSIQQVTTADIIIFTHGLYCSYYGGEGAWGGRVGSGFWGKAKNQQQAFRTFLEYSLMLRWWMKTRLSSPRLGPMLDFRCRVNKVYFFCLKNDSLLSSCHWSSKNGQRIAELYWTYTCMPSPVLQLAFNLQNHSGEI